jgi:predicted amidohydrolase YtcJ
MVLFNGKIVTVDDHGFTSHLGTVAQAMHVKDGKILHIGNNAEIRAMASAGTQVIDLKGRTVIPGIILTHEHPWDWNPGEPYPVKAVLNDSNVIVRFLEDSPDANVKAFPGVLADAVKKAKPGQWIYIVLTYGKHYEYAPWGTGRLGRKGIDPMSYDAVGEGSGIINKAGLDAAAPNNPVVVRDVFVSMQMNQKALDESQKVFSEPDVNPPPAKGSGGGEGGGGGPSFRWMFQNVVMKDYYPQLRQIMKLGLSWWSGYGMTSFASNAYDPMNVRVYWDLDRHNEMPVREMWSWDWRNQRFAADQMYLNTISNLTGFGTDYFWFGGATIVQGRGCTVAPLLKSSKLAVSKDPALDGFYDARVKSCAYAPGSIYAKQLYDYIKAGGRFVNHHMIGDGDIDNVMAIIQKASKDAGMTDDEIRAKRHTFDHSVMFPRPDQVGIMHQLGIITSGTPFEIYLGSPAAHDLWGENVVNWEVPKKRLVEGQIYNSLELDHALGSSDLTIMSPIYWMITRKAWDGKVYSPDQAVDRETALKISTIWGAYYLIRENVLGSLEPGKWADFAVLDRDYLTVPVDDIPKIRVLMTVVGGKVVHLVPSMARETGMQPAGAQVTLGGPAAQW